MGDFLHNGPLQANPADLLVASLMAVCIATDLKSRKIYNIILIPFLAAGLTANLTSGGWNSLLDGVTGFLLGLGLLLIPFAMGGIGGGDVKLLAVIGAIKGPAFVLSTFLAGALAGGLLALIVLARHRRLIGTLYRFMEFASSLIIKFGIALPALRRRRKEAAPLHLPYSLAIGSGVAVSYGAGLQGLLR